jgi:hypothetical protein
MISSTHGAIPAATARTPSSASAELKGMQPKQNSATTRILIPRSFPNITTSPFVNYAFLHETACLTNHFIGF